MSLLRPSKMDTWNIFSKKFWTFDNLFGKSKREQTEEQQRERLVRIKKDCLHNASTAIETLNENNIDEVPHFFQDPITLELINDPVITHLGGVYDNDSLTACMRRRSCDPLTNTPLKSADVKPFPEFKTLLNKFTDKKSELQHTILQRALEMRLAALNVAKNKATTAITHYPAQNQLSFFKNVLHNTTSISVHAASNLTNAAISIVSFGCSF